MCLHFVLSGRRAQFGPLLQDVETFTSCSFTNKFFPLLNPFPPTPNGRDERQWNDDLWDCYFYDKCLKTFAESCFFCERRGQQQTRICFQFSPSIVLIQSDDKFRLSCQNELRWFLIMKTYLHYLRIADKHINNKSIFWQVLFTFHVSFGCELTDTVIIWILWLQLRCVKWEFVHIFVWYCAILTSEVLFFISDWKQKFNLFVQRFKYHLFPYLIQWLKLII